MATKKATQTKNTLEAGFGKRDITPKMPFPMAGMAGKKERLAESIRDPFYARALVFSDGKTVAAVVSTDLLLTTKPLRVAVEKAVAEAGIEIAGLMISATHTHSAPGGYWDTESASLFMGKYRPSIFKGMVEGIAGAVIDAVKDLHPAQLSYGVTQTEGLNYNRRHKDGNIDRSMGVLKISRSNRNITVMTFGAHPVTVAFRENNTASADYPGELIKTIEDDGDHGMFIVGPVGAVNVFFPEGPMDINVHLKILTRLLREQVDIAAKDAEPIKGDDVAFAVGETSVEVILPKLLTADKAWLDILLYPLRMYVRRFGRRGIGERSVARVPVVRVGELVFTGFPADMGPSVGFAARRLIEQSGRKTFCTASQTDDYVGYVHMPEEYELFEWEDKEARWMCIYENGMGFGGRQVGVKLIEAFKNALDRF